ncbi:XrtA/PEP-CTERM system TPR-repeat protein PrsT [Desulfomicrobium escambiense]|uniref:XrtA/PEP-CTERM system TPR-repeat protein PrsT n=1 Tax=Desulfomicrobium escambiense TaxID=29503 RepID=UPI00040B5154|nr:XrtA/PEP-CTERM system TPR-repeat protein PrsT [Desulfomicrobium escambiense]
MVRLVATVFALSLLVITVSCKSHTKESLNQDGKSLLEQGNFNGAIIHFKNALEQDANFVEARFNLAMAYVESGKLEQAEREFQKVQLQNPYDDSVRFQLARIANYQSRPAVAVPLLMSFLEKHPDDAGAYEQLALSASISGDAVQSREYLEKALAIEPGRVSARLGLIHNFMTLGEGAKAREAIDKLLADDPKNQAALHALARLEAQERDPEGMLDVYARITSIDPGDLFARYKEGSLLIGKGRAEEVRASAESMVRDYPKKPEGYRLLGLCMLREGKYEDAVTALNTSIRIEPDLETYYLLGLAHYYRGNLELAVTQFQTVLDYSPGFAQARIVLAEIFLRQGRGAEAVTVADRMIDTSPEDFRGFAIKGDGLMLERKPREALAEYAKAKGIAPSHYGLLLKSGLLMLALGDKGGEQELLKALQVSPNGTDCRLALHDYYLRAGRVDEAVKILADGLDGSRSDAILYNALAKVSLGRKDAEGAEAYLLKAREANPSYLPTYYNAAVFRLVQGKPDEAMAQLDLALGISPDDVRALTASAAVLERQGKIEAARERLEKAQAGGDLGSTLLLSVFLQRHGMSDEAVAVLDRGLQKQPSNQDLILAKAKLHIARKETDKAMALYGQLEAADPWTGIMERTRAWMALGEFDKAEDSARRLVGLGPDKARSYLPLAAILEIRGDRVGAEAALRKGLEKEPGNVSVLTMLGELYVRMKEPDKAQAIFDSALALDPANPHALTGKGMIAQQQKNEDEAARLYLQAVQARNDFVPALNNLAMLWADGEKTRMQAVHLAMAAFARAGTDASVTDTLGYVLLRNNRSEEALGVLERASTLAPGNREIMYHKGLALEQLGRREEARLALEEAVRGEDFGAKPEAEALLKKLQTGS